MATFHAIYQELFLTVKDHPAHWTTTPVPPRHTHRQTPRRATQEMVAFWRENSAHVGSTSAPLAGNTHSLSLSLGPLIVHLRNPLVRLFLSEGRIEEEKVGRSNTHMSRAWHDMLMQIIHHGNQPPRPIHPIDLSCIRGKSCMRLVTWLRGDIAKCTWHACSKNIHPLGAISFFTRGEGGGPTEGHILIVGHVGRGTVVALARPGPSDEMRLLCYSFRSNMVTWLGIALHKGCQDWDGK